jgi:threonine efflux protein
MIQALLSVMVLNFIGSMSPGPNFTMILSQGLRGSRRGAMAITVGVVLSNILQIVLVFLGLAALLKAEPRLAMVLQILGGAYLVALGAKSLRAYLRQKSKAEPPSMAVLQDAKTALTMGFFTGMANVTALFFVAGMATSILGNARGPLDLVLFAAAMVLSSASWFFFLAWLVTLPAVQKKMLRFRGAFDMAASVALVVFGMIFIKGAMG